MKNRLHRLFSHSASVGLAVTLSATSASLEARDTVSPAVGFLRFDCPPGSDTHLSVPFQRPARWSGKLGAAPADQGNGTMRLTLGGTPSFTAGELIATPHLLFCRDASGPNGRHFAITAHSANTIDLAASPADLSPRRAGFS